MWSSLLYTLSTQRQSVHTAENGRALVGPYDYFTHARWFSGKEGAKFTNTFHFTALHASLRPLSCFRLSVGEGVAALSYARLVGHQRRHPWHVFIGHLLLVLLSSGEMKESYEVGLDAFFAAMARSLHDIISASVRVHVSVAGVDAIVY